jgi:hypothetical protein
VWTWFREDVPLAFQLMIIAGIMSGAYHLAELALTNTCK